MRELSKIEIQKVSAGKLIDNQGVVGTTGPWPLVLRHTLSE
jgi:hypothetical protein